MILPFLFFRDVSSPARGPPPFLLSFISILFSLGNKSPPPTQLPVLKLGVLSFFFFFRVPSAFGIVKGTIYPAPSPLARLQTTSRAEGTLTLYPFWYSFSSQNVPNLEGTPTPSAFAVPISKTLSIQRGPLEFTPVHCTLQTNRYCLSFFRSTHRPSFSHPPHCRGGPAPLPPRYHPFFFELSHTTPAAITFPPIVSYQTRTWISALVGCHNPPPPLRNATSTTPQDPKSPQNQKPWGPLLEKHYPFPFQPPFETWIFCIITRWHLVLYDRAVLPHFCLS